MNTTGKSRPANAYPQETRNTAEQLHKQGVTKTEISKRLGIPVTTIHRWLNPEYAQRAREQGKQYKQRNKKQCEDCGAPIWMTSRYCKNCAPNKHKRWTQQTVIQAIRRYNQQHGRPPIATEWQRGAPDYPNPGTVIKVFGSWANAIEAAGYPRPHIGHKLIDHTHERQLVKQLHAEGHTIEQLADRLRVPPSSIRGYLGSNERHMYPKAFRSPNLKRRSRQQRIDDLHQALKKHEASQ